MPISDQLIDQLFAAYKSPEDLLGEQGILKPLTKKLAERALETEMELHLGYARHDVAGKSRKSV
ncbi:MAG: IS256 family transposase, partial [Shewanella sp.]